MSAMVLSHPGNLPPLALPAIVEEDDILIHLSKPVQLNVKIGEESFSAVGNHGSFSTVPNHVPTTWHMLDPTEFFVLSVRHELLTRVALEVLDIDPKHVRLAGKVAEEDPFIYQVSQLILGEIKTQGMVGRLFIDSPTQSLVIHRIRKYVHDRLSDHDLVNPRHNVVDKFVFAQVRHSAGDLDILVRTHHFSFCIFNGFVRFIGNEFGDLVAVLTQAVAQFEQVLHTVIDRGPAPRDKCFTRSSCGAPNTAS